MEMTPAFSLGITFAAVLVALTGFSIYTSFGPPAKKLTDPFDDHDD
jgi:PsbN protein